MSARLFLALLLVGPLSALYTACNSDYHCASDEYCATWSGVGGPGYCLKQALYTACNDDAHCGNGEYCKTWSGIGGPGYCQALLSEEDYERKLRSYEDFMKLLFGTLNAQRWY